MMYLCKFGHNISTRCSGKKQISFFLSWVGYFGIVLVGKIFSYMHINVPSIWTTYSIICKFTVRYFNQLCLVRKVLTCLEIRKVCLVHYFAVKGVGIIIW